MFLKTSIYHKFSYYFFRFLKLLEVFLIDFWRGKKKSGGGRGDLGDSFVTYVINYYHNIDNFNDLFYTY
jgi:hypothetical protein